jgi:hypothetical protein
VPVSDLTSQANAVSTLQPIAVPAFLFILTTALTAPYVRRLAGHQALSIQSKTEFFPLLIFAGALVLALFRLSAFPWTFILLVPLITLGVYTTIGGAAALLLFAPAIWWLFDVNLWRVGTFAILALCAVALPNSLPAISKPTTPRQSWTIIAVAAAVAVLMGILTGALNSWDGGQTAWHHWGAYLSPVEALLSGGVPYRDFPVQYGIGPTFLLASVCGSNCWNGIYWTTVIANALQFAVLCWCVLLLTEMQTKGTRILALAAMFCAVFFWTAFPALMSNAVMTPSVSGMRFLPVTALLLHILLSERAERPSDWRGHAIWLVNMGWSMESAAYASLIWWSYLALRNSQSIAAPAKLIARVAQIGGGGIVITGIVILAMIVAYRILYGSWLDAASFFAYLNHLPTELPINPIGTVWLALAGIATAILLLFKLPASRQSRQIYICLMAYAVTGSYFLSRSHDNNVLNLFPLLILVLLSVAASLDHIDGVKTKQFITGFVRVVLASMIAFVPASQFDLWKAAADSGTLFQIGDRGLLDRFAVKSGAPIQIVAPDAIVAINDLRAHTQESFLFFDKNKVMVSQNPHKGWTGANNLANTWPLPPAMIEHYIRQGAASYHRPGWIIFDATNNQANADLYRIAYDVVEQRTYGNYRAYRLVPR